MTAIAINTGIPDTPSVSITAGTARTAAIFINPSLD